MPPKEKPPSKVADEEPPDDDDVEELEEVTNYQAIAATVLKEAMAVHGVLDGDRLAYAASIACELSQNEDEVAVTGWVVALGPVLQELLPDDKSLVAFCTKVKAGMGQAALGKVETKKDPNTLADCDNLTLGYMGKILLLRAKMHLQKAHRYGLVGENGAGKTTLMRKLALKELPGFPKDIKIMYVEPDFDEQSDIQTPPQYLKAVWLGEGRKQDDEAVNKVLEELRFTEKLKTTPIGELSGGWRMRVSLARATIVRADLLLLDEPTNHLDTAAVEWLMSFLRGLKTTAIVISHEPYFLDAVATDIIMIKRKKLQIFEGNFSNFTRMQRDFTVSDLESSAANNAHDVLNFRFPDPGRPVGVTSMTRAVVTVKEVDFRYSEKSGYILKDVSCRLSLSSRVAVTGPNGAGKSTLIKLMVGDINANKGHVWKHHNLVTAYVAQHSFSHLETVKTKPVMQYIKQRFGRGYDNESSAYKHAPDSDEKFTTSFAERLDEVEEILGRRKFKNALAYEVKWVGKPEHQNTWEDSQTLRKLGAAKLVEQCDERIKAKKSGLDQRPLTNTEVMRHLMDFGLDKQYCMARIEGLSGGQKCKLVLAAALWLRPHLLILDEPTNYLDLEALGAMMRAIDRFKGGLIVVSHNQEFIAETCNEKWDVDGGKLIQTLGIEKPKAVLVRDGRSDGVVPRGRERSQRHSSHRLSGTEEEDTMFVGELFEKIIDAKANAKERDDACDELLAAIDKGMLDVEGQGVTGDAPVALLRGCLAQGLTVVSPTVHEKVLAMCAKIVARYGPLNLAPLVAVCEAQLKAFQSPSSSAAAGPALTSVPESTGGPLFAVGDLVQALWTDKKFYKAKVTKIASTSPVKYSVTYADTKLKSATVPEKGGVKALEKEAVVAPVVAKVEGDPHQQHAGTLLVYAQVGAHGDSKLKLSVADVIAAELQGKAEVLKFKNLAAICDGLRILLAGVSVAAREERFNTSWALCLAASTKEARKGAACVVAAAVNNAEGVRKLELSKRLAALLEDKSEAVKETGLRLASRCFAQLGAAFEYQVGVFLVQLLACLGNRDAGLVKAANDTTKELMGSLSPHGARLMLPILLEGLNAKAWKSKVDCVKVLGAMAFCSPELMASSLPKVVPKLLHVMAEPKKELSTAADKAVHNIGSVITNPEIVPLVPMLHTALQDSFNGTKPALDALARTSFAHAIDPASLALIMPIAIKGIKDRKPETKKTALKVVAALAALILDIRDILPYLGLLMKNLKVMVFHNLPDIRVEAAKAVGAIVNEVGHEEIYFPGVYEWLAATMLSKETTPTQMAGAGQCLAYLMHGKGMDTTKRKLPGLLELTQHDLPSVKAGHLDLLVILNGVYGSEVFGDMFLDTVLPCSLKGLEDANLLVNEAAFEASQEFVSLNTATKLHELIPIVEQGLHSTESRVRMNYVQLLGTILLNLVTTTNFGMSVRFYGDGNTVKEGELTNVASKEQEADIEAAMTTPVRNDLFATLFLMRQDSDSNVASMAWRVWHLVVPKEKDLLMLLLPMVVSNALRKLADPNKEHRECGRKTIGATVVVCGVDGLALMIPALQDSLLPSVDVSIRKAACLAFSELLRSADKSHIGSFLGVVIPLIRDMLCDAEPRVRDGAAHAFRQLYKNVGNKAIEKIAPYLIDTMKSAKADDATVDGLCMVLQGCARNTFFFLCQLTLFELKGCDNSPNEKLRVRILSLIDPCLDDVVDALGVSGAIVVHRFCEESPKIAIPLSIKACGQMLKRLGSQNLTMREPVRQAFYQCLWRAFEFNKGLDFGAKQLLTFINDPPAGYAVNIAGQLGMLSATMIADVTENLRALVPETQIVELGSLQIPESASEAEAPEEEVAAGEDGDAVSEVIKPTEKRCAKCKIIKTKTKFSNKMAAKKDGCCKVCA